MTFDFDRQQHDRFLRLGFSGDGGISLQTYDAISL
jgi:hypothetical protein